MANKPNIRFKGFTDDWEQRKLGDIIKVCNGKDYKHLEIGKIPVYGTGGYMLSVSEALSYKDDSIGIGRKGTIDRPYILKAPFWTVDTLFYCIPKQNNDLKFIFSVFQNIDWKSMDESTGVPSLSKAAINKVNILTPNILEQVKIGTYFSTLDHLITLHQRKCDETKKLKKFMLRKMFPKNGEKNPEIRFAGFTDDWEQRKLGEWGEFYYGRSCPKWSVTEDAITPCVRYGELYTKFGSKIDEIYSYTNMPVDNLRFSKGNEVLIPRVGEDPMDYNHCTWLSIPGVAIGEMISVFNTTQSPLFSAIMFNATLQREFAMRVEGGSVTNLYYDKLKNIDVLYPTMEEQKEIARYFSTLDHLITLHQRKCDKLKLIKKFKLQNMFPKKG